MESTVTLNREALVALHYDAIQVIMEIESAEKQEAGSYPGTAFARNAAIRMRDKLQHLALMDTDDPVRKAADTMLEVNFIDGPTIPRGKGLRAITDGAGSPTLYERWIYAKSNGVPLLTFVNAEREATAMCERNRKAGIFTVGSNATEMAALKRAIDMRGRV